jgi:RHS repeat-associated protein
VNVASGTTVTRIGGGMQIDAPRGHTIYAYAHSPFEGMTNLFLSQRVDSRGRTNRFLYETNSGVVHLTKMIDADGLTNIVRYQNTNSPHLITEVENPFGRKAQLRYDATGWLTQIVDAHNLTNSFQYDTQGLITNLTTPYGTTTFQAITNAYDGYEFNGFNIVNRALLVTEPNGSRQLYLYRHLASQLNATDTAPLLPGAYPSAQIPVTDPFTNSFDTGNLWYRNSFFWGRQHYAALSEAFRTNAFTLENFDRLTTNDFKLARSKHWLFKNTDSTKETGHALSLLRLPSPDGIKAGPVTWYDYAGKPNTWTEGTNGRPSFVARVLPDGTSQFTRFERNLYNRPTRMVSTYSTEGTNVCLRTNTISYAANQKDVLEVRGNTNELLVGYGDFLDRLPRKFTNALSEVTTVTYNPTNRHVTGIQWPSGLTTTNLYFTSGTHSNWLQETRDLQTTNFYQFTYTNGLVRTFTDARGLQVTLGWDELERLTNATYPNGTFTFEYDKLDLVKAVDRLSHTNRYFYNAVRQLYRQIDPLNRTNDFQYCECGRPESVSDALGRTTWYEHDFHGRLTNAIYPGGYTVTNFYDLAGRLTNITDNAGASVTNWYSNQGLLLASSNAFGQAFRAIYDLRSRPTNIVDANGVITTNTYDGLNRIKTRTLVGANTETFNYSARGLTNYVDALGTNTFYGYDAAQRIITITNGNGETNLFQYDTAGGLTNLIDGRAKATRWAYDQYGHVTNKVDALGTNVFAYGYDADDHVTTRTDALSGMASFLYDAVGNLTNAVYLGFTNRYAYDALNRLTNMVDAVGTTQFGYDTNGLLAFEDGPWADDTVSFGYTTARLRSSLALLQPNASAWVQNCGYDSIRRLTNTVSPAGIFSYDYLPGVGAVTAASALVKKLNLPGGSYVTNSYDAVARLLSTVLKNSSQANLNSHSYLYNSVGERTKQTRLDGSFVDYAYDGIGQLLTAKGKESGGVTNRWNEQFGYGYDKGGNLHYRTNYDLRQTFTVNDANELTGVGRNAAMTVSGTTSEAATSATVNSVAAVLYGDKTFARTNVALADGNNTFTAIGQDALGRKDTNTVTIKLPASVSLQCDAKGNLTNDGRRSFVYDDENQLTQVVVTNGANNSTRSDFVYDGLFRRRIRREWSWVNGNWAQSAEVRYVYDGRLILQERDGNNLPLVTYTRGVDLSGSREGAGGIGGLLARTDHGSGQTAFYHADGNGNITALVNAQQLVVARYTYDPFGNVLSKAGPLADANLYRFSSKESHQPSGLVYYLYRFYDPNLQRWVSRDPIGVEGGINLYGFVGNNPVTHLEPFGLMWPWPQVPTWMSPDGVPHYGTPPSEQPTEKRCSWGAMSEWDNNFNGKGAEDLFREVGYAVPKAALEACLMLCGVGEAAGAGELRSAASAAQKAKKIKNLTDCVKAAKAARPFRELIKDITGNPSKWKVVEKETVPSTNIRNKAGSSVQELLRNEETGEGIVRHTLFKPDGTVFEPPHFRPMWK